jgi:phosphinothricin acetyltransferase
MRRLVVRHAWHISHRVLRFARRDRDRFARERDTAASTTSDGGKDECDEDANKPSAGRPRHAHTIMRSASPRPLERAEIIDVDNIRSKLASSVMVTEGVTVRPARRDDASAIATIYNSGIRGRGATFETRERTAADIEAWFDRTSHPILVAERDGRVVGWAAASPYRARECYAGIAEFSVYVDPSEKGRRIGDTLMTDFIPALERAGFWKVLSRIFPENSASRALCARHGFREVGTYHRHARLDGVWRDVVIVERLVGEARR